MDRKRIAFGHEPVDQRIDVRRRGHRTTGRPERVEWLIEVGEQPADLRIVRYREKWNGETRRENQRV